MSSIWRNSMGSNSGGNTSSKSTKNQSSSSNNIQSSAIPGSSTVSNANPSQQASTKKTTGNTTTKKKKTKKNDDNTSVNTGSTFFATSFIPMHSASLLKGITPIMPGPKTVNQGFLTMSSAPSLPPFPTAKPSQSPSTTATTPVTPPTTTTIPKAATAYDSEEDLPSYSSNSSDQSDSSSDDSSNSESSDSYSSASDSELKKKKKSKTKKSTSAKKKDDKKEKKKSKKKEKRENKETTQSKTQTVKTVEEEKKVVSDAKKDQAIMPPPKPVVQSEQPSITTGSSTNTTTTSSTPVATDSSTNSSANTPSSTEPPVRTKRKYTRRKDKEAAASTAATTTKDTETQGKKKRKKREVNTSEPVVSDIISPKKKQAKSKTQIVEQPTDQNLDLTIYATEDDDKLFFMDRNERSIKKKLDDNDLFYGKNYNHEILRDELVGIPWCFVKESEVNGAEKSNSIQCTTYLDAVNQENQFILHSSAHEVEDVEMKNTKEQVYEPVSIQGMNALIPIELIQNPDLFKTIFSMNTWNNVLKEEHRMFLKQFLPPLLTSKSNESSHQHNETIEENIPKPTTTIEEVKEEQLTSREAEEKEWQELMNGSGMRHKKNLSTSSLSQSSKQNDSTCNSKKSTDSPLLVKTLTQLFNKTPFLFNHENDLSKFVKRVRNGRYHPTVQLEKQQMKYLLSINLRMEYHLYIECELLARRRLSALQKINTLKLALPPCMTKPNQATLTAIEKRKQQLFEKNSKIALPQVQNSMFMEQQQTQMEPPTSTTPSQKKEEVEKSKVTATTTAPVVKERKKPGPKPKKKKDPSTDAAAQFEFVNFKSKASK